MRFWWHVIRGHDMTPPRITAHGHLVICACGEQFHR